MRRPKQWLPKQPGGNRRDTTNIRWRAILLRKFYYSFCDVGLLALQFKKYVIPAWKQTNISTFSAFSICTATSTTQGSHILQQKSCYCGKKNQQNPISVFAKRLISLEPILNKAIRSWDFFRFHSEDLQIFLLPRNLQCFQKESESSFLLSAVWWRCLMQSCVRSRNKGLIPHCKSCWSWFWEGSQLSETGIHGEQACLPLQTKWKQSLNDFQIMLFDIYFMSTHWI